MLKELNLLIVEELDRIGVDHSALLMARLLAKLGMKSIRSGSGFKIVKWMEELVKSKST